MVQEAKAYFSSVEPSYDSVGEKEGEGASPHLSARVYEVYITGLLRERDTAAALDALQLLEAKHGLQDRDVVRAPGYNPGEGLNGAPDSPGVPSGGAQSAEQGVMAELLKKEEDEEDGGGVETDELQAIIDQQLQQEEQHRKRRGARQHLPLSSPPPLP